MKEEGEGGDADSDDDEEDDEDDGKLEVNKINVIIDEKEEEEKEMRMRATMFGDEVFSIRQLQSSSIELIFLIEQTDSRQQETDSGQSM